MGEAYSLSLFRPPAQGTALALGFFDGVHLGHQAIIEQARAQSGLQPVAFTFKNHPASVIDSRQRPPLLTTFHERVERLLATGVTVVWTEFDRPFSLIEPQEFVQNLLVEALGARSISVGSNYRFGHRAGGNVEDLAALGERLGFTVTVAPDVAYAGSLISSTRVRAAVEAGRMSEAAAMLGSPFSVSAIVFRGAARGRTLGFPTANLNLVAGKVVPPFGVYAVTIPRGRGHWRGVANLGVRPTVNNGTEPVLEVHIFDQDQDLYGTRLEVQFIEFLRPERKFDGLDSLKAQIQEDVKRCRELL